MKERLFSGCAPSGQLTLGNYLGALKQWSQNQNTYDCLFCIVDLHALTLPRDPDILRERTLDFLALYLACGLDPDKSTLFIQSHNPQHTELAWILSCQTGMGELTRMTQFKTKGNRKSTGAGLLTYPVLMAADILLYESAHVPVGSDQKQHLELARDLAQRFNRNFKPVFTLPESFISEKTGRIMNLQDPSKKMDKSHEDPRTYISLLDSPQEIVKKIRRAKTDSMGNFPIYEEHSGMANLVTIYSALTGLGKGTVVWEYENRGYGPFKADLSEIIIEFLKPLQSTYYQVRQDLTYLRECMDRGKMKSREKSDKIMTAVKREVGLS